MLPHEEDREESIWNSGFSRASLDAYVPNENDEWESRQANLDKRYTTEVLNSSSLKDLDTLLSKKPRPTNYCQRRGKPGVSGRDGRKYQLQPEVPLHQQL